MGENGFVNTSWTASDGERGHGSGWSDISIGAKMSVLRQKHFIPAVYILPGISLPIGARSIGSGSYSSSLGVAMTESLPSQFSLGATYTFVSQVVGGSRMVDRTTAISAGCSIKKGLAGYAEVYLDEFGSACGGPLWMYDDGCSQTIHGRVQVDVEAGNQFSGAGKSSFIAAGIAYRYNAGLYTALSQRWAH
jgi:Putative MetA-pathway of phenol degradation